MPPTGNANHSFLDPACLRFVDEESGLSVAVVRVFPTASAKVPTWSDAYGHPEQHHLCIASLRHVSVRIARFGRVKLIIPQVQCVVCCTQPSFSTASNSSSASRAPR